MPGVDQMIPQHVHKVWDVLLSNDYSAKLLHTYIKSMGSSKRGCLVVMVTQSRWDLQNEAAWMFAMVGGGVLWCVV